MNKFRPHINPVYPPNNHLIFEEWFPMNYNGCNTDRVLLPFFPTSYWVNNNYAQDAAAKKEAQDFIDSLPSDTKYFGICQYDDGFLIDWKGKDVLEFNMSKKIGVELPLLCMPHPYKFDTPKKYIASFVGSRTHPIRNQLEKLKGKEGWHISFEFGDIESYCRVLHESIFALCPRGYGSASFRCTEAMQYGAIPIYISDEFIVPFNNDFYYGMRCDPTHDIERSIESVPDYQIVKWQSLLPQAYNDYYTYRGCYNQIIKSLETEFDNRKEKATSTETS